MAVDGEGGDAITLMPGGEEGAEGAAAQGSAQGAEDAKAGAAPGVATGATAGTAGAAATAATAATAAAEDADAVAARPAVSRTDYTNMPLLLPSLGVPSLAYAGRSDSGSVVCRKDKGRGVSVCFDASKRQS